MLKCEYYYTINVKISFVVTEYTNSSNKEEDGMPNVVNMSKLADIYKTY